MTDNVYWLLELTVNDGQLETIKALAKEMSDSTRNEEGALAYEWFLDDARSTVQIYERYADSNATMVHLGNFGEKFADRFMAAMTPKRFMVFGPADNRVREALAGFGAQFVTQFAGFVR